MTSSDSVIRFFFHLSLRPNIAERDVRGRADGGRFLSSPSECTGDRGLTALCVCDEDLNERGLHRTD